MSYSSYIEENASIVYGHIFLCEKLYSRFIYMKEHISFSNMISLYKRLFSSYIERYIFFVQKNLMFNKNKVLLSLFCKNNSIYRVILQSWTLKMLFHIVAYDLTAGYNKIFKVKIFSCWFLDLYFLNSIIE